MDRQDRPNGLPGLVRGLPENPAQGRRAAAASNAIAVPPIPKIPNVPSNSNLLVPPSISSAQVISLVGEAMNAALDENETQVNEASGMSNELRPGVTINLSHKNISKLPDEVVDIIKDALERLALSHNSLTGFPARFSECTSLRYLNVRNNKIKDFPLPLCDLKSLEILDLGRNKLRVLPPEIGKLSSLKVFSVQKNQISELPLCLADMVSLQVLKLDGNPIVFPPKDVLQVQASSPPNEGFLKESEVNEVAVTAHVKRFLKEKAMSYRAEEQNPGEESSEGAETPRVPRRAASGRFPIKVNGSDVPDIRSPALSRPPPIPTRSHFRGLSQQNTTIRKPGVLPLTIGNVNERLRSNSETVLQASKGDRPESRNRRMGIVTRQGSELGTLDETQANNRFSIHSRGLSHGSAMQGNNTSTMSGKSPSTPAEQYLQRPIYVRRLSILPERRRVSKVVDPVLEAAKGILYSVFQIHPMIQMLMSLTSDGTAKHSSLELVFYNTSVHVEELEQEIQKHDPLADDDDNIYGQRENENVQRACLTLVNAYTKVCMLLASNTDVFIDNGDPRYIRTLLTQLYNSIMELRVTTSGLRADGLRRAPSDRTAIEDTIRPNVPAREAVAVVPISSMDRANANGGLIPRATRTGAFVHQPSNLRVTTDVGFSYVNGNGRNPRTASATPRSGESFTSTSTVSGGRGPSDFGDEDRVFEKIFLSLQKSTDLVQRTLPSFNNYFASASRNATVQRAPDHAVQCWRILYQKCSATLQLTDMLKSRLSVIKLKEPGVRTPAFWNQCNSFIDAWAELGREIKRALDVIPLPADTKARLRPIQLSMKDTMDIILASPWAYYIARNPGSGGGPGSPFGGNQLSRPPLQNLPMTPQSAALGPAVQATVPSTPQSASFASAFAGNVFERADALLSSMGGLSASASSRTGTMGTNTTASSSATSLSSLVSGASISSSASQQDGVPAMMLSLGTPMDQQFHPAPLMPSRSRYDGWNSRLDAGIR